MKALNTIIAFKCPTCGSGMFGSSVGATGPMTYHCHGQSRQGPCAFTCPQDDFWRYQVLTSTMAFVSKEEYETAYRAVTKAVGQAIGMRTKP